MHDERAILAVLDVSRLLDLWQPLGAVVLSDRHRVLLRRDVHLHDSVSILHIERVVHAEDRDRSIVDHSLVRVHAVLKFKRTRAVVSNLRWQRPVAMSVSFLRDLQLKVVSHVLGLLVRVLMSRQA